MRRSTEETRLAPLDALRGLAAVGVAVFYHVRPLRRPARDVSAGQVPFLPLALRQRVAAGGPLLSAQRRHLHLPVSRAGGRRAGRRPGLPGAPVVAALPAAPLHVGGVRGGRVVAALAASTAGHLRARRPLQPLSAVGLPARALWTGLCVQRADLVGGRGDPRLPHLLPVRVPLPEELRGAGHRRGHRRDRRPERGDAPVRQPALGARAGGVLLRLPRLPGPARGGAARIPRGVRVGLPRALRADRLPRQPLRLRRLDRRQPGRQLPGRVPAAGPGEPERRAAGPRAVVEPPGVPGRDLVPGSISCTFPSR